MSPTGSALRHNAFVYDSPEEYVERSVAFLREGLDAGEGGIVAHTRPGLAAMREALGADAGRVRFVNVETAYTRPARTLAAYHQVYVEALRDVGSVRAVADVQLGPDQGEWGEWIGYESVFNRAFAHLPAWVMCTYDGNGLPDALLDGVWRTHTEVLAGDGLAASDRFESPAALLQGNATAPELLPHLRSIPFGGDVEAFRERLADALRAEGAPEAKALDMLLAGTEIATNALTHGGGVAAVRVGRVRGRFVCEIIDRGRGFADPTAGYIPPRQGAGTGLWVARQLTWRIEFFHPRDGFTTRIWL
jgi:anti-sigma regulatory factor (Ser/Thr protein kinase)